MGQRNLARRAMTRAELIAFPLGWTVVDGNMTIYTKCDTDLWESETGRRIHTDTLHRPPHIPVRPWTGPIR